MRAVLTLLMVGMASFTHAATARAEVKMPAIFGDHMVLQEGRDLPFWGTAAPGETVTVRILDRVGSAVADATGRWRVDLPPFVAKGPFEVEITGTNRIAFGDVVMGEVWFASGQSNMEFELAASDGGKEAIASAADSGLRLFRVNHADAVPAVSEDVNGKWVVSAPESAATITAVGFYFARALRQSLQKPVGIVHTAWGGTPAEAWTRASTLGQTPELASMVQARASDPRQLASLQLRFEKQAEKWDAEHRHANPPNRGEKLGYAKPGASWQGFTEVSVPGMWEDNGLVIDGVVWYRREVSLPPEFVGKALRIDVGGLNDCGTVYANGVRVGDSCRRLQGSYAPAAPYTIEARLVTGTTLTVAVRVFDERGRGGFRTTADLMSVTRLDEPAGVRVPLAGRWLQKVEKALPQLDPDFSTRPIPPPGLANSQHAPGALFRYMLEPMIPFAMRGVIWYQGETNAGRPRQYRPLFSTMIRDWREAWGQGDFPFLFVQLANFDSGMGRADHDWGALREAQSMALSLPNTGMAVAIDIGNPNDIHPTNKLEVGRRLSLWALSQVYGKTSGEYSGPLFAGWSRQGKTARVAFSHGAGLRPASGKALVGFTLAGTDRKFFPAQATVENGTIVLSAPEVSAPAAVRYGFSDAPVCNLQNAAGLPASPFRTDDWGYEPARP